MPERGQLPVQVKLLVLSPFPPRSHAIHGAGRVVAQFIMALPPRYRIALYYLHRQGDAPLDEEIRSRCEYVDCASLPLAGGSIFRRWQRLVRLFGSLFLLRPMWVTDLTSKSYAQRLAKFAEEWRPDLVHLELHVMGQYLSCLEHCPAPRVLVEHEPGVSAAPYLKSPLAPLNNFVHAFDRIAWKGYESQVIHDVQAVVTFTQRDREILERHGARAPVHIISPGVKIPEQPVDPLGGQPPSLLFAGNFIHPPNIEAAKRLVKNIFPLVRRRRPDVRCLIVGDDPPTSLKRLGKAPVIVTERVPDITPYLAQASLAVAPIYSGGGMRIKVLEALAAGKAIVATPLAITGLDLQAGEHVAVAESDEQFAAQIIRLLDEPQVRAAMAARARAWAGENLGWDKAIRSYERLVSGLLFPHLVAQSDQAFESTSQATPLPLQPVSLVICSRNRPQLLLETVQSVLHGDTVPSELVIIDQSEWESPILRAWEAERGCVIRYVHSPGRGLSHARNSGLAAASCDMIAFTDDDMYVSSTWLAELTAALLRAGPRAAVTGRVLPAEPERRGGFAGVIVAGEEPKIYQGRIGKDVLVGAQMIMTRSTIAEVGLFDQRLGAGGQFQSAEDNDYGYRLLEAGYKIIYAPQAVIYHRAWRDWREYFRLRWSYGRGKGGFYLKHASLRDPYMLRRMVWDILLRCIRFPWRFLHRPRLAVGDLISMLGILSGALEWLRTQKRPQSQPGPP